MSRKFQRANYEQSLNQTVRLGDVLPANHLARFVVDIITQLDLSEVYGGYADQGSLLIVAQALSNHPNDKQEAAPTLDALPPALGKPEAAALDNGYFSEATIQACEQRGIDPYIAAGREAHHLDWQTFFQQQPDEPAPDASPKVQMAYKLQTDIGQAIYRLRKGAFP